MRRRNIASSVAAVAAAAALAGCTAVLGLDEIPPTPDDGSIDAADAADTTTPDVADTATDVTDTTLDIAPETLDTAAEALPDAPADDGSLDTTDGGDGADGADDADAPSSEVADTALDVVPDAPVDTPDVSDAPVDTPADVGLGNGAACSSASSCASNHCVDGVCCDTPCTDQCEACGQSGSVGKCSAVVGDPVGGRTDCANDVPASTCGGTCNGSLRTTCAYPTTSQVCRSASCTGGIATARATCDGGGHCPALSTTTCSPFLCGATSCTTSCTTSTDCAAPFICNGSICGTPLVNGSSCSTGAICQSGLCADGVCCDKACTGQCEACALAASKGTCSQNVGAPAGTRTSCTTDGTAACAGSCTSATRTACTYPTSTTNCIAASCSSGTQTNATGCDGAGHCPASTTKPCTPFVCGATACKTSCSADSDCIPADYCNGSSCAPKLVNGTATAASNAHACVSGIVADAVCCNSACGGSATTDCQACNVAGKVGTCSPSPSSTVCRPVASGVCDTAESCNGTSTTCPSDTGATCPGGLSCVSSACVSPTGLSCAGGLTCGSVSCCDTQPLPAGTFMEGRAASGPENDVCSTWATGGYCGANEQPEFSSTVAKFSLDMYEVTVGRFRKFVAAYPGNKPTGAGVGANPNAAGSGWQPGSPCDATHWDACLAADQATLISNLKCEATYATWTDSVTVNENLPINCVDWYTAFAFCAWDGGRLPTEAEWEYAASGGEQRPVPWTTAATSPDATHAVYTPGYTGAGAFHGIAPVGSVPLGVGKFGQHDLAGNMWEWAYDWYGTYPTSSSNNYAGVSSGSYRVVRGGSFGGDAGLLRASLRNGPSPPTRSYGVGLRCARTSP